MNITFEEGVAAVLLLLAGVLLGIVLRGGNKWRRRYEAEHERFVSLEAERDGWRARHQVLENERETWARERAEWERHHATAPRRDSSMDAGTAPASSGAAMAAGLGTSVLHGHPDNVAPLRRDEPSDGAARMGASTIDGNSPHDLHIDHRHDGTGGDFSRPATGTREPPSDRGAGFASEVSPRREP